MKSVFLSYRTVDSVHATAAISAQLAAHFVRGHVFRDHDSLVPGAIYPGHIRRAVETCDTMLAVIGPHWLNARYPDGTRCLDDERDWVRFELATAFRRGIPVVPLLLDQTPLPSKDQLPAPLAKLSLSNFWQIRHQTMAADVQGLIERLGLDRGGARPAHTPSANNQYNTATGNGIVFANQGGDQHFNGPGGQG
jgi:hypothetical protein